MSLLLAYFDPSAGSLLLQLAVGGFGGVIVFGRYLWQHFRGTAADVSRSASSPEVAQPVPHS
jgi:hypothetical protein